MGYGAWNGRGILDDPGRRRHLHVVRLQYHRLQGDRCHQGMRVQRLRRGLIRRRPRVDVMVCLPCVMCVIRSCILVAVVLAAHHGTADEAKQGRAQQGANDSCAPANAQEAM